MIKYFTILFFFILSLSCFSQSLKQYVKMGDKAFKVGNYPEASVLYKKAIKINSNIIKVNYKYAESCRLQNKFKEAEKYYKKVISTNQTTYPLATYYLAEVLKYQGQYQKAQLQFSNYYKLFGKSNDYYAIKAKHEIYSCEKANILMFDVKAVIINKLDTNINSEYSELSTYEQNDSLLYFTSFRPEIDSIKSNFTSKVYRSLLIDSTWKNTSNIQLTDSLNKINISNFSFFSEKEAIFTICINEKNLQKCKICTAEIIDNKITNIKDLPETINQPNSYNTQASITNLNDERFIIFSSNRAGGYGNMDLWYSKILSDGTYDIPQNLGNKINSPGNEISPFFNYSDSTLYYSSDWFENFGGYDIFKIKGDFYYWNKAENLGYPINTVYNDLYYNINKKQTRAYLTSNRLSENDEGVEHCCNDIYYIKLKEDEKDTVKIEDNITTIVLKDIKELIPITLYFHNDEPNPRTTDTITQFNYNILFNNYMSMIEEYKREYSAKLKGEEKNLALLDIEDFFSNKVEHGLNQLDAFAQRLEVLMANGENVIITLKGYTSPLNTTDYNKKLAKRRISSLKNYFLEYNNGVFQKYMNNQEKNYLKFELVAIGEELVNKNVSDDLNDKRNSVFSPNAALERKIQIIAISVPD